jgi:hypothetical protein
MQKAYIVMKKGYEYDDSIYNQTDGGTPKTICFTLEDAKQKVKELNIEAYKEISITDYAYEYNELVSCDWEKFENFNLKLIEKYGEIPKAYKWDSTENRLHPSANEDEINEYCKMVLVSFYDVVETDIDLSSWRNQQINSIVNN